MRLEGLQADLGAALHQQLRQLGVIRTQHFIHLSKKGWFSQEYLFKYWLFSTERSEIK